MLFSMSCLELMHFHTASILPYALCWAWVPVSLFVAAIHIVQPYCIYVYIYIYMYTNIYIFMCMYISMYFSLWALLIWSFVLLCSWVTPCHTCACVLRSWNCLSLCSLTALLNAPCCVVFACLSPCLCWLNLSPPCHAGLLLLRALWLPASFALDLYYMALDLCLLHCLAVLAELCTLSYLIFVWAHCRAFMLWPEMLSFLMFYLKTHDNVYIHILVYMYIHI